MTKNKQKSLGSLRIQQKTKPRSPELKGMIRIQRHTIQEILEQMDDDEEVIANIAAWKHHDGNDFYLSVELSPKFTKSIHRPKHDEERSVFDLMENE